MRLVFSLVVENQYRFRPVLFVLQRGDSNANFKPFYESYETKHKFKTTEWKDTVLLLTPMKHNQLLFEARSELFS